MREKRIQIEGQDTAYLIRDNGTVWSEKRNRELKGTIKRNEYATVYLSHAGKQYNLMIHRLVAEAFCPNPNNYNIVHHKDNNKLNNNYDNLEWVTTKENNIASISYRKKADRSDYYFEEFDEHWKKIPGYENYWINDCGTVVNEKSRKILRPTMRNGYFRVGLQKNSQANKLSVHRLVYETFVGEIPPGYEVDHINGVRDDNSYKNLRLVTRSENMYNAMANGHSGQVPVLQFTMDGDFIQEFPTIQAAADAVGVTHAAIRSALNHGGRSGGFRWKKKNEDMP